MAMQPPLRFESNALHRLATSSSRAHIDFQNDPHLCSNRQSNHIVELVEIGPDPNYTLAKHSFSKASDLSSHLTKSQGLPSGPSISIFLVHQQYTWAPLNVSKAMISTLMSHFGIAAALLQNLSMFRDRTYPTEEAYSGPVRSMFSVERFQLGYVFKYPERKKEIGGNPWRIRQTGLYHLRIQHGSPSIFILISPSSTATFAEYLQKSLEDSEIRSMLVENPMLVHNMLLSTHFDSWRAYLEYQETLLINADMKAACTALNQPLVSFETLKHVREIEKALHPLEPLLKSFKDLVSILALAVQKFEVSNTQGTEVIPAALSELQRECSSYREHAAYLAKRSQSTAQSISDTLSLHQSESACSLARSARDDSVAIKILTLVASFYLPFSFVATMLGMNLVNFDETTRDLVVSNQFWLYFALAIPLMAVTSGLCWLQMWKHNRYNPSCSIGLVKDESEMNNMA